MGSLEFLIPKGGTGSIRWAKRPDVCFEVAQNRVKNGDKLRTWTSGMKYNTLFTIHYIDCEWSSWSKWSDCSAKCGGGRRSRTREKHEDNLLEAGQPCVGSHVQQEVCNSKVCTSS